MWQVIVVSCIVLTGAALAYPVLPRHFEATANLLIRHTNTDGTAIWDQSDSNAIDDNVIQTKLGIIRSQPLLHGLITQFGLMDDPEFNPALNPPWWRQAAERLPFLAAYFPPPMSGDQQVLGELSRHLVVRRQNKSYLIEIGYWSGDPAKAALLTNALAAGFLESEVRRRWESHQELLANLEQRLAGQEAKYQADEAAEQDFARNAGIANGAERAVLEQQIKSLSLDVAAAYLHMVETRNRAAMLSGQADVGNTADALGSPILQQLRQHYVELRSGTAAPTPGTSNITVEQLRLGILAETQHIVVAAQNEAAVAQKTEAALRAELARLSALLADWDAKQRHRDDLHRAVQSDLDALTAVHAQATREAARGDALQADITIVAPGVTPDRPVFPTPLPYAAGALGLVVLLDGLILLPVVLRRAQARDPRRAI